VVRDEGTGTTYLNCADVVIRGFRTIPAGERVRFLIDHAAPAT
jgi:hypothetical protein